MHKDWVFWLLVVVVAVLAYDRFVKKVNFTLGGTTTAVAASTTTATVAKSIDQLAIESIAADNI
jgi:hypothetical protein